MRYRGWPRWPGKDLCDMERKKQGIVYLVGAGPGAPGLLTLRGKELLSACDAVVYDHLASERFLDWVPKHCHRVYVGKQAGQHSMKQEEINNVLVKLALKGLNVVRLKGGDPFVFGRGGEEVMALAEHGILYEVVPGVTSAVAVPECAGIPVTHRAVSRSFHVITGHTQDGGGCLPPDLDMYGKIQGTLVFLMGLGQLPAIAKSLMEGGRPPETPAAVIEKGTLPGERTVRAPLGRLYEAAKEAEIGAPAIIVVGETASYEMKCGAFKPLGGIRVGITGTGHFTDKLKEALEAKGAQVSLVMEMKVESHAEEAPMQEAYGRLKEYGWIVFTSANGVRLFFQGLVRAGRDYRALGHVKFAVIGDGTGKELESHGFLADFMPDSYSAKALAQGLAMILTEPCRVLIARSEGGSPELTHILADAGIPFDDIILYHVQGSGAALKDEEDSAALDYLTFASASGARALFQELRETGGQISEHTRLACIGAITARELEKQGRKADITAARYHIDGLVQAIVDHAGKA